jgi:hypothetical protein
MTLLRLPVFLDSRILSETLAYGWRPLKVEVTGEVGLGEAYFRCLDFRALALAEARSFLG